MQHLNKLSPAPWRVRPLEHDDWGLVRDANGVPVSTTCMSSHYGLNDCGKPEGPEPIGTNAHFIALARNAHDVMIRRGLYVVPMSRHKIGLYWRVRTINGYDMPLEFDMHTEHRGEFKCPYEALVVADQWLADHEEKEQS